MRPMAALDPGSFDQPELPWYALVDSGGGQKLERFGPHLLARPDPQALWRRRAPARWDEAALVFVRESDRGGRWEAPRPRGGGRARELEWRVAVEGAALVLRTTPFKHVGVFPEQATNWRLVERAARAFEARPRLLNLFGYSGAASVLACRAGWAVTHVDASRLALSWTRANLEASGLPADALRLVLEDALAFARREARRGQRYEAILVDPPRYGRGPKGETWRFDEDVAELVEHCDALLAERALLVLSAYAIGLSPWTLQNLLAPLRGRLETGELLLAEEPAPDAPARVLPCGFCARLARGFD